ncbi:MAG: hypothetical protein M0T72_13310 [Candidatus Dormibacteraeota bacterium]|nr:hypothetical protein [Candidatus Dormibacteraeota bacterium]
MAHQPLEGQLQLPLGGVLLRRLLRLWEGLLRINMTRRTRRRSGSCCQPVGVHRNSATSAPAISRRGRQLVGEMCRLSSHITW